MHTLFIDVFTVKHSLWSIFEISLYPWASECLWKILCISHQHKECEKCIFYSPYYCTVTPSLLDCFCSFFMLKFPISCWVFSCFFQDFLNPYSFPPLVKFAKWKIFFQYLTQTRKFIYHSGTKVHLHMIIPIVYELYRNKPVAHVLAPTHGSKNHNMVLHPNPSFIRFFFSRAVGHMTYGSTYREQIVDKLRKAAEDCDCLQCFFLIHSMGGGKAQRQFDPIHAWKQWCSILTEHLPL